LDAGLELGVIFKRLIRFVHFRISSPLLLGLLTRTLVPLTRGFPSWYSALITRRRTAAGALRYKLGANIWSWCQWPSTLAEIAPFLWKTILSGLLSPLAGGTFPLSFRANGIKN